jgi:thymidine phosphorylase
MRHHRLLLLALAVAGFAATPPAQKQTAAAHARTGGPAPKVADVELEKAIQARFAKSKIAVNKFQVRVQGGTATIEGRTDVIQHKGTATRLARSAGAVNVVNKVQVSEAARQKAAGQLTSGRRRAQVKRSEVPGR